MLNTMPTSRSNNAERSIRFSDRVECPRHGRTMVLVTHRLSDYGRKHSGIGVVTFYRCTATVQVQGGNGRRMQCTFMRPNKYQVRAKGERHK